MNKKLHTYLKGKSREEFARALDTSRPYVDLWVSGIRTPRPPKCVEIQELTKNQVTVLDLLYGDDAMRIFKMLLENSDFRRAAQRLRS